MVKNAIKSKIKIKQKFKNIKIKYYFHLRGAFSLVF